MTVRSFASASLGAAAFAGLAALVLAGDPGSVAERSARAEPLGGTSVASAVPVVVALYTSEGCSSCPAADAVLTRLERTQPLAGVQIVTLEMHVDIWDNLGWTDPFSQAELTARLETYARTHRTSRIYTPEAVVDGAVDVVGSDEGVLRSRIAEAARRPQVTVRAAWSRAGLLVDVAPSAIVQGRADVRVAWVQPAARIEVHGGENGGRTLDHTAIVRTLVSVGATTPAGAHLAAAFPRDRHWYPVVLVEDAAGETLAAAVLAPPL